MFKFSLVILCLAFFVCPVFAKVDLAAWQKSITAGKQAADAGKLVEAQQYFSRALALVEMDDTTNTQTAETLTCLGLLAYYRGIDLLGNDYYKTVDLQFSGARSWEIGEVIIRPHYASMDYGAYQPFAAYRAQAAFNKAADYLQRVLKIRQLTLKANDPALLAATFNISAVLIMQGKPYAARELLEKILTMVPPNTPLEATLLLNQVATETGVLHYSSPDANPQQSDARTRTAIPLLKQVLAIREKAFGAQSPQVLMTRVQTGNLLSWVDPYAAVQEFSSALVIAKKLYPPDDHNVLALVDALEAAYQDVSDSAAKVVSLYTELASHIAGTYPKNKERCLPALLRLGWHYSIYGEAQQAREPLLQALNLAETAYGKESLQVADVLDILIWQSKLGEPATRTAWEARSLAIRTKIWGADSANLAEYQFSHLTRIEDRTARMSQYARLQGILEKGYGSNSMEMLTLLDWQNSSENSLSLKLEQQQQQLKQQIILMGAVFGLDHPVLTPLLLQYGERSFHREYSAEGEAYARRALAIQQAAFGPSSPEILDALYNLQDYCYLSSQDKEREKLLLQALAIEEGLYGKDNLRRLNRCLDALKETYGCEGKLPALEMVLRRLLGPQRPEPGDKPVDFSYYIPGLASVLKEEQKFAEAEPYYLQAVTLAEKKNGSRNFSLTFPLRALAEFYEAWGIPERAQPIWERSHSLSLREKDLGNDVLEQ